MPASAVSSPTASTRTRIARVGRRPCRPRPGHRRRARHGPRLAGDHRLVELGFAVDDHRRRPARGTGTHQYDIAARRSRDGDSFRVPSSATRSASSGSSAASASSAPWAWPMARISSQWPSSMIVTSSASSTRSRDRARPSGWRRWTQERDADRQRDQQHHARRAGAQFVHGRPSGRRAAVEEDDRAENRGDRVAAGEGTASRSRANPGPCRCRARPGS